MCTEHLLTNPPQLVLGLQIIIVDSYGNEGDVPLILTLNAQCL